MRHETYSYNTSVLPFLQFMYKFVLAGATAYSSAYFGRGTGGIYLDNLGCRGNELRLINCYHSVIGVHNCDHSDDAGLRCQRKTKEIDFKITVLCNVLISLQPVNRTSYVRHFAEGKRLLHITTLAGWLSAFIYQFGFNIWDKLVCLSQLTVVQLCYVLASVTHSSLD